MSIVGQVIYGWKFILHGMKTGRWEVIGVKGWDPLDEVPISFILINIIY